MADALEDSIYPVWFVRPDSQTISNANHAARALTGHTEDELKGKPLEELFTPDTVTHILSHCSEEACNLGFVGVIKKDRSVRHLEVFCQSPSQKGSLFLILGKTPQST
jgi:PAS domain S-box-containing protein